MTELPPAMPHDTLPVSSASFSARARATAAKSCRFSLRPSPFHPVIKSSFPRCGRTFHDVDHSLAAARTTEPPKVPRSNNIGTIPSSLSVLTCASYYAHQNLSNTIRPRLSQRNGPPHRTARRNVEDPTATVNRAWSGN